MLDLFWQNFYTKNGRFTYHTYRPARRSQKNTVTFLCIITNCNYICLFILLFFFHCSFYKLYSFTNTIMLKIRLRRYITASIQNRYKLFLLYYLFCKVIIITIYMLKLKHNFSGCIKASIYSRYKFLLVFLLYYLFCKIIIINIFMLILKYSFSTNASLINTYKILLLFFFYKMNISNTYIKKITHRCKNTNTHNTHNIPLVTVYTILTTINIYITKYQSFLILPYHYNQYRKLNILHCNTFIKILSHLIFPFFSSNTWPPFLNKIR